MNATSLSSSRSGGPPRLASPGLRVSIGLHVVLLLLVIFGLPAFFDAKRDEEPVVISVEIMPIGPTNIKPASHDKPAPEMEQPKEQPKPAEEAPKPPPPKPVPPTSSAPPPQETSPRELISPDAPKEEKKKVEDKPKVEEKPKPKPEEKKPEKKSEESMEDILKSIENAAKKNAPEAPPTPKPAEKKAAPSNAESHDKPNNSTSYDASKPMSMSERDAIVSQLQKCWSVPAGARDAQDLAVLVKVRLNQDGSLISATLADGQMRYAGDSFYRAAADSAMRAVRRCTPLQGLPTDKYGSWQEMDVNFDPKNMF